MKTSKLLQIQKYLSEKYSDIGTIAHNGQIPKEAILSAISEFAKFDYDPQHKFFIRDIKGVMFATEKIELNHIDSLSELHEAISYLNDAHDIRLHAMENAQEFPLDSTLLIPPEEVRDISRNNVLSFLKDSYGIDTEEQLFALDEKEHKKIVFDIYRNFTGYVPFKESPGSIIFSVPQHADLRLRYSGLPDFKESRTLLSHLITMRSIKENTEILLENTTAERMRELEDFAKEKKKERDREQELER